MDAENLPERKLIGVETRASNDNPQVIGEFWQEFMSNQIATRIPNRTDENVVAIYCEYEGDYTKPYTLFLGCVVEDATDVPDDFVSRKIPAGQYVKRIASGAMPDALIRAWVGIWNSQLERSYETDFEVHDPTRPEHVEIHLGVK